MDAKGHASADLQWISLNSHWSSIVFREWFSLLFFIYYREKLINVTGTALPTKKMKNNDNQRKAVDINREVGSN